MNTNLILKAAFPGCATKSIANGIGCSLSQAERMLKTGKIPRRLREAVTRLAYHGLNMQLAVIKAAENGLREAEAEEIVLAQRAGARDARGTEDTRVHRVVDGSTDIALKETDNGF